MSKRFQLKVFRGKKVIEEPETTYSGCMDELTAYQVLKLAGFDGRITLRLDEFWNKVIQEDLVAYTTTLTGYETIIKFGNTMQLKEPFTVAVEIIK